MSDRRLAILGFVVMGVALIAGPTWIRIATDGAVDTTAIFGLLTLIVVQIGRLGGGGPAGDV